MATLLKKYVGTDEAKENGDVLKCECTSNHASPTGLGKWTLDGVSRYVFSVLYVSKVFKYLFLFKSEREWGGGWLSVSLTDENGTKIGSMY